LESSFGDIKGVSEAVNQRKTDQHNGKIKRKIRIKVTMIEKTRHRNIQIEYKKNKKKICYKIT
jgi:hypothetical protein